MIALKSIHPIRRRRGLASVAVLIAMIIIAMVCAGLIKVAMARRAKVMAEERRVQANCLVDSGLGRAMARLEASPDYPGEVWEIPTEDLGGRGPGVVAIEVEKVADRSDRRKVRVRAEYPAGSSLRSQQSRELIAAIKPPGR